MKSHVVWLKSDQVEAMRDAAYDGLLGHRDEAIIALLYDTGLRRAELAALDRAMLDFEDDLLRIPVRIQKNYPNERTPSPVTFELDRSGDLRTLRALQSYLSTLDGEPEALFPSRTAERITGKGVNDVVKRAADRADVRPFLFEGRGESGDVSAHTLRHSVAYWMLREEEGNTLYDVRNRLWHASILTTERNYDHFDTV